MASPSEKVGNMWRRGKVRWQLLEGFMEVERGVWMRVNVVGPHATCHVGRGCEGRCGTHGDGCRVERGSL